MNAYSSLLRLLSTFAFVLFCVGLVSCEESKPLDDEVSCEAGENECPNICEKGAGVLAETCSEAGDCQCGLFCKAGVCSPYEDDNAGCVCEDGTAPEFGPDLNDCPKGPPENSPCNPYCQLGCDEDEQCSYDNMFQCTGIGTTEIDDICTTASQCQRGFACFKLTGDNDSTCKRFCIDDNDCPNGRPCNLNVNFGGGGSASFCGAPTVGCNPFKDECAAGETCVYKNNSTRCEAPGSLQEGAICHNASDSCVEGFQCLVRCMSICSLGDDDPKCTDVCPNDEVIDVNVENEIGICLADTPQKMCEIFEQTGCPSGQSCYPTRSGFACYDTGEIEPGGNCQFTNDCVGGYLCINNACQELCHNHEFPLPGYGCNEKCESSGVLSPAEWEVGFCQDAEPAEPCNFWAQDCDDGKNCYVLGNGSTCLEPSGSAGLNQACSSGTDCTAGLYCLDSKCIQPCSILEVGVPDGTPICIDVCPNSDFSPISMTEGIGKCNDG